MNPHHEHTLREQQILTDYTTDEPKPLGKPMISTLHRRLTRGKRKGG